MNKLILDQLVKDHDLATSLARALSIGLALSLKAAAPPRIP